VGREEPAEVALPDPGVSRRHARVTIPNDPDEPCVVEDLGSTNGTVVNGTPVTRVALEDGDRLQVGSTVLRFEWKAPSSARYTRKLYRAATRDPLTDTLNREQFTRRLATAWEHTRRLDLPIALLLVDLDHFKRVNDTHGHQAGDRALQAVAGALQSAVRKPDAVGRYGGEEFAVLLPETGLEEAAGTAERLRLAVEELEIAVKGGTLRITASVGVASAPPLELDRPEALIQAADAALYRAKDGGRNCCRPAEQPDVDEGDPQDGDA
jgi:diguanylate cyclase (GGDEF)-like protein